jgi:tRNA(Ile)-lysidine synthase
MSDPLAASVRKAIRRHQMLSPGGRVIVALSGGPDSVALLHILHELGGSGELVVAGVAHFNHQLRGAAADADQEFCRELAASLELPFEVGTADVGAAARLQKRSVEDAARTLRYAFLHEAAGRLDAGTIAVGHSRDDQAETFLLRLLRGAGTRGLGAIRPKAGMVIRPLIDISRADLRRFVRDRCLPYRDDETNADVRVPRNRVRHELLPYLEREFSPGIVQVLANEATLARQDDDRLESEAIDLARSIVLTDTPHHSPGTPAPTQVGSSVRGQVVIGTSALTSLHPALGSRVARIALGRLAGGRFIGFEHVQRFMDFVRCAPAGSAISLPGQQAIHQGDRILLGPEPPRSKREGKGNRVGPEGIRAGGPGRLVGPEPAEAPIAAKPGGGGNSFRIPLSIPGEVVLGPQRLALSASWADSREEPSFPSNLVAMVSGLKGPLTVRSRQPGDRFRPPGLGGRARKLQDYLVDRKVDRSARDLLPLVVDQDDRIVWIVGHAVAEGFRAAEPSPGVILLIARRLGGEV